MENVGAYLKEQTGYDWQELSPLYLKFKMQNPPFQRMCVFTPDDIRKQRARLYQTDVMHSLHNPNEFVEKYLNVKKQLIKSMPWIKIDLDQFPPKPFYRVFPDSTIVTGNIYFSGDIKLRPIRSQNDSTIGLSSLKNISTNAKLEAANILKNTLKINLDLNNKSLSVGISSVNAEWSTSLTIDFPNVKAEITPVPVSFTINQWQIELNLSLVFKGEISHTPPPPTTPSHFWKDAGIITLEVLAGLAIIALIVFTDGVGALIL